jgi:hypothetical protein
VFAVEIFCRNEQQVVAAVETPGALDVAAIRSGFHANGPGAPDPKLARDGEHLLCARCSGRLWFRLANGDLHPGIPGVLKVAE